MSPTWMVFVFSLVTSGVHCGKRGTQPNYEAVVCEGKSLEIKCKGQQIEIVGAEYGRTEPGSKYCPLALFDWNTKCYSTESTLEITKKECDGFRSCTLYANNVDYGNPCFGTHKYLKVNYRCIPATPEALQKIRVCEGHQAYIDCPNERKIEIDYANYGRLKGAHVCGFLIAFNTNCGAESSMATVERDCTDQNSCLLEANNAKFGKDPCPLTLKYLEVHYRCRNF